MITVRIENEDALEMLMDRVRYWTDDRATQDLYEQMYSSYIDGGCFDGGEFDVMAIVDNDYINWCTIVDEGDEDFEEIKAVYEEQGIGDCSCEGVGYGYIEAVDDESNPTSFLMRH